MILQNRKGENMRNRLPPLAVLALCLILAFGLAQTIPWPVLPAPLWLIILEILCAGCLLVPAVASFIRKKTTMSPVSPERATQLVSTGVFGFTRNPMYLGMLLLMLAFALWLGAASSLLAVAVFFWAIDQLQIPDEENALLQSFGQDYAEYKARVPRWLIFNGAVK